MQLSVYLVRSAKWQDTRPITTNTKQSCVTLPDYRISTKLQRTPRTCPRRIVSLFESLCPSTDYQDDKRRQRIRKKTMSCCTEFYQCFFNDSLRLLKIVAVLKRKKKHFGILVDQYCTLKDRKVAGRFTVALVEKVSWGFNCPMWSCRHL